MKNKPWNERTLVEKRVSRSITSNYLKPGEITKRVNRLMERYKEFGSENIFFKEKFETMQNWLKKQATENPKAAKLIKYDSKKNMYRVKTPKKKEKAELDREWFELTSNIESTMPQKNALDKILEIMKEKGYKNYDYTDAYVILTRISGGDLKKLTSAQIMAMKNGEKFDINSYIESRINNISLNTAKEDREKGGIHKGSPEKIKELYTMLSHEEIIAEFTRGEEYFKNNPGATFYKG